MFMKAHAYKELYRGLNVPIVDENEAITGWRKVDTNKYLPVSNKNSGKTEPISHSSLAKDYNIQHRRMLSTHSGASLNHILQSRERN